MKNRSIRRNNEWGGKSGLHRAGWFLTGTVGQKKAGKESAAENRLPAAWQQAAGNGEKVR
jgi:hypothetical protein